MSKAKSKRPKPKSKRPKPKPGSKPPSQRPPIHGGGSGYNDNTHMQGGTR